MVLIFLAVNAAEAPCYAIVPNRGISQTYESQGNNQAVVASSTQSVPAVP